MERDKRKEFQGRVHIDEGRRQAPLRLMSILKYLCVALVAALLVKYFWFGL